LEVATAVVRRRRLLERWLTDVLGLDAAEAHEEAHRLEQRVMEALGRVCSLPSGEALPGRS
jgi:DtxR family Mn-dependent transcriptional regulator